MLTAGGSFLKLSLSWKRDRFNDGGMGIGKRRKGGEEGKEEERREPALHGQKHDHPSKVGPTSPGSPITHTKGVRVGAAGRGDREARWGGS